MKGFKKNIAMIWHVIELLLILLLLLLLIRAQNPICNVVTDIFYDESNDNNLIHKY
jgi:hypothetical protein